MKKVLFTYIFICHFFSLGNGQNSINNTNIDLSFISPKWKYVNSFSLEDNTEIQFINSITDWDKSYNKGNPLLLMDKGSGLLMNYYVTRDVANICPTGFRVPSISDYKNLSTKNITFNKKTNNPNDFIVEGINSIQRGSEEIDGLYSYYDDIQNFRFWVKDEITEFEKRTYDGESGKSEGLGKAITFERNGDSNFPVYNSNFKNYFSVSIVNKQDGLNLYCVESYDKILEDSIWNYKNLLPRVYDSLVNVVSNLLLNSNSPDFKFSVKMKFDSNGSNISDNFSVLDKTSNSYLYNSIKNAILGWNVYPYYNDIKVRSNQSIDISHQSLYKKLDEKRLFSYNTRFEENYLDKFFLKEVYKCDQGKRDFRYTTEIKTTKTTINNSIISQKEIQTINKFIGKGPIYSVYSLLPGLGKIQITKNSEKSRDVAYSRKLNFYLGTSISLGIIGGAAKLVSNHYYNEYKRQVLSGDPKNNFKIANISQKIFLSCLFSYGAMFVWDFSSTFGIGIGNKVLQRKVNKKLRKLDTPLILK